MRQQLKSLALLVLCLFGMVASAQQQQAIETRIDRTEITRGETITLQVRVYGQQGGVQIELEPLRENFEIVSTRSASHLRSVNNRIESWTDYMLVLFPRALGEQEVPALSVAGRLTQPFTITVNEPSAGGLGAGQEVYMETILSKNSVYVQEQLLYTIRLYYTIAGIRNPNFTEVEPADAVVQLLGQPHQYEQLIDGVRYGVYEKNYAIFPQRSGELLIPDIVFRGELTDGSSNFVFRNPNMRPVTAFAGGYTVDVKERPLDWPAGTTFLPARNLEIREVWSRDITSLEPGDAVQRTLTLVAEGLDGPALPPLGRPEIDRMNVYPEQPQTQRMVIDGNVVGSRTESYELVATSAGSAVIPEINIPWWDITTDTLRNAVIPASFIRILPVGGLPADAANNVAADAADSLLAAAVRDDLVSSVQTPAWILNMLALVIALTLAAMWWLWRRRLTRMSQAVEKAVARSAAYAREIAEGEERQAFSDLENSLAKGEPQQIRLHLIAWGRQYFGDAGLYNLDDLATRMASATITDSLRRLQAVMYGDHGAAEGFDNTQRSQLLSLLKVARGTREQDERRQMQEKPFVLPPLYQN
jgi:hypothetical protein